MSTSLLWQGIPEWWIPGYHVFVPDGETICKSSFSCNYLWGNPMWCAPELFAQPITFTHSLTESFIACRVSLSKSTSCFKGLGAPPTIDLPQLRILIDAQSTWQVCWLGGGSGKVCANHGWSWGILLELYLNGCNHWFIMSWDMATTNIEMLLFIKSAPAKHCGKYQC